MGTCYIGSTNKENRPYWIKDDIHLGFDYPPTRPTFWDFDVMYDRDNDKQYDPDWSKSKYYPPTHATIPHKIQITYGDAEESSHTVLHEMGHAVMGNIYGNSYPSGSAPNHTFGGIHPYATTAWKEGWATTWMLMVTGNSTYIPGGGGDTIDLEDHNPGDSWNDGDLVEGRIIGALLDIADNENSNDWYLYYIDIDNQTQRFYYDNINENYNEIWDTLRTSPYETTFESFWDNLKTNIDTVSGARALFQNTIVYEDDIEFYLYTEVDPSGSGIINKNPDRTSDNYTYNETVTLTKDNNGWTWQEWQKFSYDFPIPNQWIQDSTSYQITKTMNGDRAVRAKFLDTTPPTITSTNPYNNQISVPVTSNIGITFSEEMNRGSTQSAFSISPYIAGTFSWEQNDTKLTWSPDTNLSNNTNYAVTITTGAEDKNGVNMDSQYQFSFTTIDTIPPTITATDPYSNETNVPVNSDIEIIFSEGMDRNSTQSAFSISPYIAGSFFWGQNDTELTYSPDTNLSNNTYYTVTITTEAEDKNGVNMDSQYQFSFTTINPPPTYTLSISSTTGGNVTAPGEGSFPGYSFGDPETIIASPEEHYHFSHWSGDNSTIVNPLSANTTIIMNGNYTITANFEIDSFNITASVNGTGGNVTPTFQSVNYGNIGYVQLIPDEENDYYIESITDNGEYYMPNDYWLDMEVTENHTIIVTFGQKLVSVTANISGGHGYATPASQDYLYGDNATINIYPDPGYHISTMTDNGQQVEPVNPYIITDLKGSHEIYITFSNVFELNEPMYEITLDSTNIDSNLTHFPVLLHLSDECGQDDQDITDVFDEVGNNYKKIAITEADKTTQLYVEVESWNATSEEAWLWISRENWTISSSEDTKIYFYCDNDMPINTVYVGEIDSTPGRKVWDSDFIMVHHMVDDYHGFEIVNSNGYRNNGEKEGENTPVECMDMIGYSQTFFGNDSIITIEENGYLYTDSAMTIEVLGKIDDPYSTEEDYPTIAAIWDINDERSWMLGAGEYPGETDQLTFRASDDGEEDGYFAQANSGYNYFDSEKHLFSTTWDESDGQLYIDGSPVSQTVYNDEIDEMWESYGKFSIGGGQDSEDGHRYISGNITEVRLSETARSAAWMKATYHACRDDFASYDHILLAKTSMTQEVAGDDVVVVPVNIDLIKESVTGDACPSEIIDSYNATATYVYAPPDGIEMIAVRNGDLPFDSTSSNITNANPGDDYTVIWEDSANGTTTNITVARLVPRLIGCCLDKTYLTLYYSTILDSDEDMIYQQYPVVNMYQRGDVNSDGIVNTQDALMISQYMAHLISLDDIHAINAASAAHDGESGDKIKIGDALTIAQYAVGNRDCYFEFPQEKYGSSAYKSISDSAVSVEPGKIEKTEGDLVRIPIVIKDVPKNNTGIGAYVLNISYDTKSMEVVEIIPGKDAFTDDPLYNIMTDKGEIILTGINPEIATATGDVVIAYLVVKTNNLKLQSSSVDIEVVELVDGMGNEVQVKQSAGNIKSIKQ